MTSAPATPPDIPITQIVAGQFHVSRAPARISTVLGSCVAACVRDPVTLIGGMNHFMLPHQGSQWKEVLSDANRYGTSAMENLINEILKRGALRQRLEVKVFGGANIGSMKSTVGQRNIAFIETYLVREGLTVEARSLGGNCARKVQFDLGTGKVRMLSLPPLEVEYQSILRMERSLESELSNLPEISGDLELFT